jgi:hypothetical protein
MSNGYWRSYKSADSEWFNHCADSRHKASREATSEFQFPVILADDLKAIFETRGARGVADGLCRELAGLFNDLYRLGLIQTYLDPQPRKTEYRRAAERLAKVLCVIDRLMVAAHEPARRWEEVSLALSLPSSSKLTEEKIGRQFGLTKMAISKMVTKILQLAELKPHGYGYNGRQL